VVATAATTAVATPAPGRSLAATHLIVSVGVIQVSVVITCAHMLPVFYLLLRTILSALVLYK
jgi:hypothetical protein